MRSLLLLLAAAAAIPAAEITWQPSATQAAVRASLSATSARLCSPEMLDLVAQIRAADAELDAAVARREALAVQLRERFLLAKPIAPKFPDKPGARDIRNSLSETWNGHFQYSDAGNKSSAHHSARHKGSWTFSVNKFDDLGRTVSSYSGWADLYSLLQVYRTPDQRKADAEAEKAAAAAAKPAR